MIVMRIGKQGGNYDYHYWYTDILVSNGKTLGDFISRR